MKINIAAAGRGGAGGNLLIVLITVDKPDKEQKKDGHMSLNG